MITPRRKRSIRRAILQAPLAAALLVLPVAADANDQTHAITTVTVDDLFPTRILEVLAGTEVVFSDPRFLQVEIVPDEGAPVATPITGGFTATFKTPGTFRFLSTVVGVARAGTVPCEIIVRPRPGVPSLYDFSQAKPGVSEAEFQRAQEECLRDPRTAGSAQLYLMCMQARGIQPFQ